tara:strand:- start:1914 stop:2468 length:555 start_codon:yes stop_codon:yes gene_type:complete
MDNVKIAKFNIIVATCKNMGIGYDNTLPWNIKSDLRKFRILTIGNNNNAIIMGKNTWNSLPIKPLPFRDNLILSNTLANVNNKNCLVFNNIDSLINYCINKNYDNIWIIGGAKIYNAFIDNYTRYIYEIYITHIEKEYKCDSFFPDITDNNKFICLSKTSHNKDINKENCNIYDIIYRNKDYHE